MKAADCIVCIIHNQANVDPNSHYTIKPLVNLPICSTALVDCARPSSIRLHPGLITTRPFGLKSGMKLSACVSNDKHSGKITQFNVLLI